ncbi:MAG: HD domain-containing protein [Acholeplasma sp.]|jgi:HD superfamily phosphohydrolase|nr:HD domain-containing protein [Acholeplasma sp.]
MDKNLIFTDNIHGVIRYGKFEKKLIESQLFARLHNIHQSSTVFLTFPSNKTCRYEHSLGVMHVIGKMYYRSFCNSNTAVTKKVIKEFNTYINDKTSNGDYIIDHDYILDNFFKDDCFFNDYLPSNIKDKFIYLTIFQVTRIIGLLHDVGHPPFSHVVEYAIESLFETYSIPEGTEGMFAENFAIWKSGFTQISKKKLHEKIGIEVIKRIFETTKSDEEDKNIIAYIDLLRDIVIEVLSLDKVNLLDENNAIPSFIYSFISSTIDADRLDFILRDSKNTGAGNVFPNYERLYSNIKVVYNQQISGSKPRFTLAYAYKTIDMLDELLNQRNFIYTHINYHHNSSKMALLLEEIVLSVLSLEANELKNSEKFEKIVSQKSNILSIEATEIFRILYCLYSKDDIQLTTNLICQWDDNWLMLLLRKYQYDENTNQQLKQDLNELFSGKPNYITLIKRNSDFKLFVSYINDEVKKIQKEKGDNISIEFSDIVSFRNINVKEKSSRNDIITYKFYANLESILREATIMTNKLILESGDLNKGFLKVKYINRMKFSKFDDEEWLYDNTDTLHKYQDESSLPRYIFDTSNIDLPFFLYFNPENKELQIQKKSLDIIIKLFASSFTKKMIYVFLNDYVEANLKNVEKQLTGIDHQLEIINECI